mgnify:CR=1 FL=1|tara:strand:+ start:76 stop:321 length:246 start_codon:yes stop_codon:yes gene_type:complete
MAYIHEPLIEEACTKCEGFGTVEEEEERDCPKCDGVGFFLFYESNDWARLREGKFHQIKIGKGLVDVSQENLQDQITEEIK